MQTVTLNALLHRNKECIGIYFDKNTPLEKIIRKQNGVKWSQTNGGAHSALRCSLFAQMDNQHLNRAFQ